MEEELYFTWAEIQQGKHFRKTNPDPVVEPILERFKEEAQMVLLRGFMGNEITFLQWAMHWWGLEVNAERQRREQGGI